MLAAIPRTFKVGWLAAYDVQAAEELHDARQALFRRAATRTG